MKVWRPALVGLALGVFCVGGGMYLGSSYERATAQTRARAQHSIWLRQIEDIDKKLAFANSKLARSAGLLEIALESQILVERQVPVRVRAARKQERTIVAQPPTEQGAAESMERANEFERRQETR
ncbi:MAG: hypothetical protein JKY94_16730 [Rhodobacteraceae bacterium]|nr:hypothetical protein [Paracoccaceae bacterium]